MGETAQRTQPMMTKRLAKAERRHRLLRSIESGKTLTQAADEEGIHVTTAGQIVARALRELAKLDAEMAGHLRDIEARRLGAMQAELWPAIERKPEYFYCTGCGAEAPTASEVDHGGVCTHPKIQRVPEKINLRAHETLLRIMKRRAELLGLDMPTRVEHSGKVEVEHGLVDDAERKRLEETWRRRPHADAEAEAVAIERG